MDTCPKCHRKLLAHSSPRCNWCGAAIEDTAYQDEASKERDAFFTEDRQEQAAEIADVEALSPVVDSVPQYHAGTSFLKKTVFERHNNNPPDSSPLDDVEQEQTADTSGLAE